MTSWPHWWAWEIELTPAPQATSGDDVNAVLTRLGASPLAAEEWTPLRAA